MIPPRLHWCIFDTDRPNYDPEYGSDGAIGMDLRTCEDIIVSPGVVTKVPTNIKMAIPYGYYGRIAPRSGLALKQGIDVMAGVVDPDYRGEICVLLTKLTPDVFLLTKGEKVAQIIFERADRLEMLYSWDLGDTARGTGGFGSTDR